MSALITSKLSAVRYKHAMVAGVMGTALAVGCFVAAIFAGAVLDWWFEFPWALRAVLLVIYVAGAAFLLARHAVMPILYGPDDEAAALLVEHDNPEFATRLIASVQFSRAGAVEAGASAALVRAMIAQTVALAEAINFNDVIDVRPLMKAVLGAAIALVLGSAAFVYGGGTSRDLLARVFLSHTALPTKARVQVTTGDFSVAQGDNAVLSAKATGWWPADEHGSADIEYQSGRRQTLMLTPDKNLFSGMLDNVGESFQYRIRVYDGRSEWYQVQAIPRPAVARLDLVQVYPAYTELGETPRQPGDLSILFGSKLRVTVQATKALRMTASPKGLTNHVTLYYGDPADPAGTKEELVPLAVSAAHHDQAVALLDLSKKAQSMAVTGFSIQLVDDEDIASKDPAVYRVDMVADRSPTVRITYPDRKEVLVTAESHQDIGFLAEDDYGIAKATLKYKVDDGDVVSIPLDLSEVKAKAKAAGAKDGMRVVRGFSPVDFSRIPVPKGKATLEGSVMEYWLEVEDANDITGPGKGASDHYQARVVTKEEKQAELMSRLGESLSTLRDVSESQEKASTDLGTLIQGKTGP